MTRLYSLLIVLFAVLIGVAHSQTPPTASVVLNYTMPMTNTDGSSIPATGPNSLAKVQIWLSLTPWASGTDVSGTPTSEAAPGTTSTSTFSAAVGATVYARMKVCNVGGVCSDSSNQASGIAQAAKPGSATLNTVTIRMN